MRNITVIGVGYVGLVTGTCFADLGNRVCCLDVDEAKVKTLEEGGVPIYEPGLEEMVRRNVSAGRLCFTTDYREALAEAEFVFIAVGTPEGVDGEADLKYVRAAFSRARATTNSRCTSIFRCESPILRGVTPESLQAVSLAVAQELSLEKVLCSVVHGLASQPGIALASVWLVAPGDICVACPMRPECPDQARCLHLAASDGNPTRPGEDWSRVDGSFRRFPLGVRKVGRVGATGVPLLVTDVERDAPAFARPEWIRSEGIRSFGCQPLVFR